MRLNRYSSTLFETPAIPRHRGGEGGFARGYNDASWLALDWHGRGARIWAWCRLHQKVLIPLLLVLMCVPIWNSLDDHGFNGRSDVRYAVVAQDMVRSGDWLVPTFMGEVHLTKPPLMYWLEAGSIELLGHTYFAVRVPSAISGTLVLLLLFWFARRVLGVREAIFACGLYAIMPMTIFPARMSVTDSVVNLCWLLVLCGGYLMRTEPGRKRWALLFWGGACIGMLAKGPVLFIPIALVLVWWGISSGPRSPKRPARRAALRFIAALMLAMLPTLLWALAVLLSRPEAASIWWHETFDRVTGSGDHARPFWFFIPVLLVGCFPCSAMLLLPGINLRWRQAWAHLKGGDLVGYLGWAVAFPFVFFSLSSGKLPSYLLPICAPMAMLSAGVLARWFDGQLPTRDSGRRQPETRWSLMIGTMLFLLAAGGSSWYFFGSDLLVWSSGLVLAAIASVLLVMSWGTRAMRPMLMGCFIVAWGIGWAGLDEAEDKMLSQASSIPVEHRVFGAQGWTGRTAMYGLNDAMIYWDRCGDLERFDSPAALEKGLEKTRGEPMLVLADARRWDAMETESPKLFARGQVVGDWTQWPGAPTRYLVLFDPEP